MFPRWRAQAEKLAGNAETAAELLAPEVFLVVTSYRIPGGTSLAAYTAAIEEAARYPRPVTIVAAVVEMADQRLVKDLFRRLAPPPSVRLILVRGPAAGKRDGLARALAAVARQEPTGECRGAGAGRRRGAAARAASRAPCRSSGCFPTSPR